MTNQDKETCCSECSASREATSQINPYGRTIYYCTNPSCKCHQPEVLKIILGDIPTQSKEVSKCCGAPKAIFPPDFQGNQEVCSKCGKPFIPSNAICSDPEIEKQISTPASLKDSWEERFDKFLNERCSVTETIDEQEFVKSIFPDDEGNYRINKKSVKDFIRKEREQSYKEGLSQGVVEATMTMNNDFTNGMKKARQETISEVKRIVEGMKLSAYPDPAPLFDIILAALKKMKGK